MAAAAAPPTLDGSTAKRLSPLFPRVRILRELERGGSSTVFSAQDKLTGAPLVVKAEHSSRMEFPQLAFELRVLRALGAAPEFGPEDPRKEGDGGPPMALLPAVLESASSPRAGVTAAVLPHYGLNMVDSLAARDHRHLWGDARSRRATLALVGNQVLRLICWMRDRGVVHRDIKPENIVWSDRACTRVVLLDFGLARFMSKTGGKGDAEAAVTVGTDRYSSPRVDSNEAGAGTWEDDVVSLAFSLWFLGKGGSLPWMGVRDDTRRRLLKRAVSNLDLVASGVPDTVFSLIDLT
jgi:serine/threonine protein kinase